MKEYDITTGRRIKKRKPFKVSTKKKEWNKSAGRDEDNFKSTSKCRVSGCRKKLIWGNRGYEFDHKNNDNSDNSQKNCYLVCRDCHGKHTIIKKRKTTNIIGIIPEYKTIKKKVGYKKRKKKSKPKKKRKIRGNFLSDYI